MKYILILMIALTACSQEEIKQVKEVEVVKEEQPVRVDKEIEAKDAPTFWQADVIDPGIHPFDSGINRNAWLKEYEYIVDYMLGNGATFKKRNLVYEAYLNDKFDKAGVIGKKAIRKKISKYTRCLIIEDMCDYYVENIVKMISDE